MTSAGSTADTENMWILPVENGSRPSEQLFVQDEGEKKQLVCADKGVSLDLQSKTRGQVLVFEPQ